MIMSHSVPDLTPGKAINCGNNVRSIDCYNEILLVGTVDGTLAVMVGEQKKDIMHSHNDGEVWGLCQVGDSPNVLTCGDDNKTMCWNTNDRKMVKCHEITSEKKDVRGASSQSRKPSSQQGRAVCMFNGCVVVACNDGAVRVKDMSSGEDKTVIRDAKEWCQILQPSPDGSKLAVGSHDNKIRVYDSSFQLLGTCNGHTSYVTAVDWDAAGECMRSNSGDYELLFWDNACN